MRLILLVYSEQAFKEYLLPSMDNADYNLLLQKDIFCIANNLEVKLEVIDQNWCFISSKKYQVTKEGKAYFAEALKNQDVIKLTLDSGECLTIVVRNAEKHFAVYEKFTLEGHDEITIGKNKENLICFDDLGVISRKHGKIVRKGSYYVIEDQSKNGIFINHSRIQGSYQLAFGDCIDIFGLRITFLGEQLAINAHHPNVNIDKRLVGVSSIEIEPVLENIELEDEEEGQEKHKVIFHRSPRYMNKLDTQTIEIEAPPAPKQLQKQPLAMIIGPSMTMALPMLLGCGLSIYGSQNTGNSSGLFMYTGLVTAVSCALVAVIWSVVNLNYAKKKNREEELHRFESYSEYLIKCTEHIKEAYEKNTRILRERYIEPSKCCQYDENTSKLWERNFTHEDFLAQRIGIGDSPFQTPIVIPKERFTLINDSLAQKPKFIKDNYETLKEVPVCVDMMQKNLIGIIGGKEKRGAISVIHTLAAQIAANNCYTDVKMIFVYNGSANQAEKDWCFAKWLPHVWSEDKRSRFVATNKSEASDIFYELTKVLRFRQEEYAQFSRKGKRYKPHYILFIESPEFLEGELITKYIFDNDNNLGLTTLLLVDHYEQLPNACTYLIQNDEEFKGIYEVNGTEEERKAVNFDSIAPIEIEKLARNLANIEVSEMEVSGEIPNALTFFDMYQIHTLEELEVLERWKKNRTYENMKALIGQKSGGRPCYLDVHEKYHGPHGLIAGTTGSGKSETLQTYILSLAINYSPDDIGFFIIDYKGGGMANLFSNLPHLVGQISNLSGNQTRRAMVSIKSENKRRQRIFNEHGVNNINLYTRLYKNNEAKVPVPHLFIIIDEFAELKREEPDFMRELISVAQVGRSLGVHLILATQKPSGTVDDNIWSNSKFRLCLRVQDRQDSNDMLHKPDAAYITQAGRCYMQVGNDEIYELFQSGYSGATYDDEAGSKKTDIAKMLSITGKAALVGSKVKKKQKEEKKQKWISTLIQMIYDTADSMDRAVDEVLENDLDELINELYIRIKQEKIDYTVSEYNTQRLMGLIRLYKSIKEQTSTVQEMAQNIISLSEAKGIKLPEMKDTTQLDVVIEYLQQLAKQHGYINN
ncbi:MAG: type VII secretion protein EssC, partial [Cellulosilyticum sp.]|nr:type VII secretion protein EssC [Cellulosilyticum sp.]